MSLLYLDASAITKLVVEEVESTDLRAALLGQRLATSRIAIVEVSKAVGRVDPSIDPGPVFDRLSFLEFDATIAEAAVAAGGPGLRSLDAIHAASAQALGEELAALVTYDSRQTAAARAAGLSVLSPGAPPA